MSSEPRFDEGPTRKSVSTSVSHFSRWNDDSSNKRSHLCNSHHHVESVHFMASGIPLHPALAVVQTPGREYFVLKDNGMQVGCEEDGVAPVWMEILQCDQRGLQTNVFAAESR